MPASECYIYETLMQEACLQTSSHPSPSTVLSSIHLWLYSLLLALYLSFSAAVLQIASGVLEI